jgi:hypothetical protein
MKTTIKAIQRGVKAALAGPKPQRFQAAGGKTIIVAEGDARY